MAFWQISLLYALCRAHTHACIILVVFRLGFGRMGPIGRIGRTAGGFGPDAAAVALWYAFQYGLGSRKVLPVVETYWLPRAF